MLQNVLLIKNDDEIKILCTCTGRVKYYTTRKTYSNFIQNLNVKRFIYKEQFKIV